MIIWINIVCIALFFADQIFKYLAQIFLSGKNYLLFKEFYKGIGLHLEKNENIAFSINIPLAVLIFVILVVLVYLFYVLYISYKQKPHNYFSLFYLTLIIAGALSNLFDRFIYGAVIDYIHVFLWPTFNLADVMIVAGVVLWAWDVVRSGK